MTRFRAAAAIAAIMTALLLQGALVGPWTVPVAVSLPAVLVAVIGLHDGPSAGMTFGFTAGLVADLGSHHPAGVLALCWLGLGLVAGLGATERSVRGDAAVAAVLAAVASTAALVILALLGKDGASLTSALRGFVPTGLGDALLALAVVAVVRRALRSDTLRAPHSFDHSFERSLAHPLVHDLSGPGRG